MPFWKSEPIFPVYKAHIPSENGSRWVKLEQKRKLTARIYMPSAKPNENVLCATILYWLMLGLASGQLMFVLGPLWFVLGQQSSLGTNMLVSVT